MEDLEDLERVRAETRNIWIQRLRWQILTNCGARTASNEMCSFPCDEYFVIATDFGKYHRLAQSVRKRKSGSGDCACDSDDIL